MLSGKFFGERWMLTACLVAGGLIALPAITLASTDPGITIESSDPPDPIFLGGITNGLGGVQLTGDADVLYQLEDDTGIITSITFDVQINKDLSVRKVLRNFSCTQPSGQEYFKHCDVTYDRDTGILEYSFFGVKPPEGDELCPQLDCEVGEKEGIPPGGSFFIELTGWTSGLTVGDPVQLYMGLPTITSEFTSTAPEPSMLWGLGLGLFLIAGVAEARRRKRSRSATFAENAIR